MKKILEVLQYGETDIRFNTDLKPTAHPDSLPMLVGNAAFAMTTKLWGGNELDVLAVIRALAIANLAVSVNRKDMIKMLDKDSETFARILVETRRDFEKNGGRVITFPPEIMPSKTRN